MRASSGARIFGTSLLFVKLNTPILGARYFPLFPMNDQKAKTLIGLKKAYSLIKKLIAMTENDEYCVDIMQQNLAAIGLLKSAHKLLMEGHLKSCFSNAMDSSSPAKKQQMITEILAVSRLANK